MEEFKSVDDILDFAIEREEEAYGFYTELAKNAKRPGIREMFEQFAGEEQGHKAKLLAIKKGKVMLPSSDRVVKDLKIGDYLVDVQATPDLDYQQVLIVAMKKEKAAFRLYNDLAARTTDDNVRAIFLSLAQEEAKHKLRFEVEYDEMVMTEN